MKYYIYYNHFRILEIILIMFDLESAITNYMDVSSHTDDIKNRNILIYKQILNSDYNYTTYINKQLYSNINIIYNIDKNYTEKSDEITICTEEWNNYLDSIINFYRNEINKFTGNKKINIIINNKLLYNYIIIFHNEHIMTY